MCFAAWPLGLCFAWLFSISMRRGSCRGCQEIQVSPVASLISRNGIVGLLRRQAAGGLADLMLDMVGCGSTVGSLRGPKPWRGGLRDTRLGSQGIRNERSKSRTAFCLYVHMFICLHVCCITLLRKEVGGRGDPLTLSLQRILTSFLLCDASALSSQHSAPLPTIPACSSCLGRQSEPSRSQCRASKGVDILRREIEFFVSIAKEPIGMPLTRQPRVLTRHKQKVLPRELLGCGAFATRLVRTPSPS